MSPRPRLALSFLSIHDRLQVFHCTQPADVGGENILVDGFNVAEIIREKHPETYKFFSEFPIEAEYIHDDPDDHFLNLDFVFKHHPVTKELQQFRFNIYDRAVHR